MARGLFLKEQDRERRLSIRMLIFANTDQLRRPEHADNGRSGRDDPNGSRRENTAGNAEETGRNPRTDWHGVPMHITITAQGGFWQNNHRASFLHCICCTGCQNAPMRTDTGQNSRNYYRRKQQRTVRKRMPLQAPTSSC